MSSYLKDLFFNVVMVMAGAFIGLVAATFANRAFNCFINYISSKNKNTKSSEEIAAEREKAEEEYWEKMAETIAKGIYQGTMRANQETDQANSDQEELQTGSTEIG